MAKNMPRSCEDHRGAVFRWLIGMKRFRQFRQLTDLVKTSIEGLISTGRTRTSQGCRKLRLLRGEAPREFSVLARLE